MGLLGILKGYTFITHYASNRFSLTFFSGLLASLGLLGVKITAFLVVTGWFGGLFLILDGLNRFIKLNASRAVIIFASAVIEYYSLYLAPNQFQILYWRTGILPYTTPLILSLFIIGLLVWQLNYEKHALAVTILLAPLAFIAGGFSEGGNIFLVTASSFILLGVILYLRSSVWAKRLIIPASTVVIFSLLATVVLLLSPANALRYVGNYPDPTKPWLVPFLSIRFTFDFVFSSIRGLILPYSMFSSLFFLMPILFVPIGLKNNFNLSKSLVTILVVVIVSIILIAVSQAPAVYIEKGPPAPRGLIFARFTLNFAIALIFGVLGNLLIPRLKEKHVSILLVCMLVPILYTIRPIWANLSELPRDIERAAAWDARDISIRNAKAQGILQIDVKGIDSKYIGHTRDLKEKPTFWINACAESYYGMEEIRATLPQ